MATQSIEQSQVTTQPATQASLPPTTSRRDRAPRLEPVSDDVKVLEREMERQDNDSIASARACMETREFLRAVHVLRECKSSKARFLSLYSKFMVCQRRDGASPCSNLPSQG